MPDSLDFTAKRETPKTFTNTGGFKRPYYLRFEDGKTYQVRLIGQGVEFYKIFGDNKKFAVVDKQYKDEASRIVSDLCDKPVKAQSKFAINCVDRSDSKIKVLEGGRKIFDEFFEWSRTQNINASDSSSGVDWRIEVTGQGLDRVYKVVHGSKPKPLTEEEISLAKKIEYKLKNVYKAMPIDEIAPYFSDETVAGDFDVPNTETDSETEDGDDIAF